MEPINPYAIKEFIAFTPITAVEELPEIQLAMQLHVSIRDAWPWAAERPRWSTWYDQIYRASLSVLLQTQQGWGRGRGYLTNDLLGARGELFEVLACLSVGDRKICDPLKPVAKDLLKRIDETLIAIEEKPNQEKTWGRRY